MLGKHEHIPACYQLTMYCTVSCTFPSCASDRRTLCTWAQKHAQPAIASNLSLLIAHMRRPCVQASGTPIVNSNCGGQIDNNGGAQSTCG